MKKLLCLGPMTAVSYCVTKSFKRMKQEGCLHLNTGPIITTIAKTQFYIALYNIFYRSQVFVVFLVFENNIDPVKICYTIFICNHKLFFPSNDLIALYFIMFLVTPPPCAQVLGFAHVAGSCLLYFAMDKFLASPPENMQNKTFLLKKYERKTDSKFNSFIDF